MSRKRKIGNEKETQDKMNGNKENLEKRWSRKKNVSFLELVKWKQSGKVNFFRKKSKNTVRCSF